MLYKIDAKLKEIFHLRNKTPFGGIGMMFVGDLLQIPPVKGKYIFQPPNNSKNLKAFENLGLWKLFEPWILKHNHRQGEGGEWANCLNRLRLGIVTEEDLNCLKSRETDDPIHDLDSIHLCYTNQEVQDHNGKMLSKVEGPLIEVEATKKYPKGRKPFIKNDGRIEDLNVLDILQVKIGARVTIVYNVNVIDDLVNGATGTIVGLEYDSKNNLECIIVNFDKEGTGDIHKMQHPKYVEKYKHVNGVPIYREEMEPLLRSKKGNNLGIGSKAKIYQLPLVIFYACTNHKIQVCILISQQIFVPPSNLIFKFSLGFNHSRKLKGCSPLDQRLQEEN